jgi:hypothetical protein
MAQKDSRRDGASRLSNLKVTKHYLNPDYDIQEHNLTRGRTGLLRVFSLVPKKSGIPSFQTRVDDGSQRKPKEPELDIDIEGVDGAIRSDFKTGRNGYLGHHTKRVPNPQERIFDVEIAIPNGRVFEGEVFFNVNFSVSAQMRSDSVVELNAEVIRAPAPKPDSE